MSVNVKFKKPDFIERLTLKKLSISLGLSVAAISGAIGLGFYLFSNGGTSANKDKYNPQVLNSKGNVINLIDS